MAEFCARKVGRITKDRISELPQNILESILCFLPIEDAMRTSILSKKWRHCWTMMPHLIFDYAFAVRMINKFGQNDGDKLMAYKYVSVINKTLLLHRGPILKFSLSIPRYRCDAQIIHDYIDQWIPLLSSKGIKQLDLMDSKLQEVTAHHFSSLDLTHLRLFKVWFTYRPAYGRFTHLTNLHLHFATSNFGQSIFDCPVLEKLSLTMCTGLFYNNFHAPNLKRLHQIYNGKDLEIPFAGLENLTEYSLMLLRGSPMGAKMSNVVRVFSSLQKIEKFSIARAFMKYLADGGCPNRLSKPLPYLKTLNVCDINFTQLSEVSCLLCMIQSAPNLHKLYISGRNCYDEADLKKYCIEDSEDRTALVHLEIVTFSYISGLKAELELVKFILAHSPLLKIMFIYRNKSIKKGLALTMTEEILEYPKASTRAQIRYLKHHVDVDDDF